MPLISIKPSIQIDLQSIVDGLAELDTSELEAFADEVNTLLAQRKAPSLSKEETQLITRINQGLPIEVVDRFQQLRDKQDAASLTAEETEELAHLVEQIETAEARRLEYMIALAGIWKISIDELRVRLGIQASEPYVS